MLQIGDIRIHFIHDGTAYEDAGGFFGLVPRVLYSPILMPDKDNLVPSVGTCLLVQVGGRNILIDTGRGEKMTDKWKAILRYDGSKGRLTGGLARLGIQPEQIDLVVDTHLHGDHSGGNTRYDESGAVVAAFPKAEYVTQRREYQDASRPNERTRATYVAENFQPLLDSGQMRLLDGDTQLAPGIFGVVAPGHTPGHMAVRFESGGQHAAFVCDMASYAIHFERLGWMTAFDVEPLVTLETKRKWQQWALETDATIIFPHDAHVVTARLTEDALGKRKIEKLPAEYA